jgi:hypothetical protein
MLQTIIKIIALGGPLVLAVMGFIVMDRPPATKLARCVWYAAFSVVALIGIISAVIDSKGADAHLEAMLMGGKDDFPEIFGSFAHDGVYQLMLANGAGNAPLFDVTFSVAKAGTANGVAEKNWGTLLSGAWNTGIPLGPGNYQINISARNGFFIESLAIGECKGLLAETFLVWKQTDKPKLMRGPVHDPECFKDFPSP